MKNKTVLITGITGFVGSHMADYLLKKEPSIKIFGIKRQRSNLSNILHLLDNPHVSLLEADLLDMGSIIEALKEAKPDYIFHFAAQSAPQASFLVPKQTIETNIIGTLNLLEGVKQLKLNKTMDPVIISVSSSEVYGNPLPEEVPIKETNIIRAANPYSISKVGHDLLSQYYQKAFDLKIIITRLFSHEGSRRGRDFAISNFARQVAEAEKMNLPLYEIKVGNLKSVRTYVHVSDALEAYFLVATQGKFGEVYNIGGTETCTVGEALESIISMSTLPRDRFVLKVDPALIRPTDITLQIPDCTKFKALTGWEVKTGLAEVVEDTLNYWRKLV